MKLERHLKVGVGAAGAFVFGLLFGWAIFPALLKSTLKKEMSLSPKTDLRQIWTSIPFAMDFKIYLFNYTNVEDIQKGAPPIVKEIGPYHFDFFKTKVDMSDNEANDTISYRRLDTFYLNKELSAPGLTGEEVITMPNVFIIALTTTVVRTKPSMLSSVEKAINSIFDNPSDVFFRVKALDFLFRGFLINCAKTDFAAKAVCTTLKNENVPGMVIEPDGQIRLSIFGGRNATMESNKYTVLRGTRNVMDVGRVVAINGVPRIGKWRDACDEFDSPDGTIFPPFVTERESYYSFSPDLCRSFKMKFIEKISYQGIKCHRYFAFIGDLANDPRLQCFCDTPNECPVKGLMDLTKCLKVPMYVSLPHYLHSDPSLVENVKGLNPTVENHIIVADFEPITGSVMENHQRAQMSMQLIKVEKMKLFKDLQNTYVPIFWVDEGFALNKTWVSMLNHQLFIPKRVVAVVSWLLVIGGALGMVAVALIHFKVIKLPTSSGSAKMAQVNPQQEANKEISIVSATPQASKSVD